MRDLTPLLACRRLAALDCSNFDGRDDQASLLLQAHPGLDIRMHRGYEVPAAGNDDSEKEEGGEGEEDEDEGGGRG